MKSILRFSFIAALLFAVSGCGKKSSPGLSEKSNVSAEPTAQPAATDAEVAVSGAPQPPEVTGIRNASSATPAGISSNGAEPGSRVVATRSPSGTNENAAPISSGVPLSSMNPDTLIRQLDEYIARLSADAKRLSGKDREKAEKRIESLRQSLEQQKKDLGGVSQ